MHFSSRQGRIGGVRFSSCPLGINGHHAIDSCIKRGNTLKEMIQHFSARNFSLANFLSEVEGCGIRKFGHAALLS
jgi:hypothetical protein